MDSSSAATSHERTKTFFSCNMCKLCALNPVATTYGHVYRRPCLHAWLDLCGRGLCRVCRAVVSSGANVISIRLNGCVESADQSSPQDIPHAEHPEIQVSDTHEGIPATPIEDDQILSLSLQNNFDVEDIIFDDEDLLLDAEAPEVDEDLDLDALVRLLIGGGR